MTGTTDYLSRSLSGYDGAADEDKAAWLKFGDARKTPGDAATIVVTDTGMAPDYEFSNNPNAPKVQKEWPNGDKKEFMVVTGTLEQPARVGDGGAPDGRTESAGAEVRLAVKGKLMTQAIAKAVHDAGKDDIEVGGKLWIKFTEWTTSSNGFDTKAWAAKYQPPSASSPTASFLGDAAGAGDAPPF